MTIILFYKQVDKTLIIPNSNAASFTINDDCLNQMELTANSITGQELLRDSNTLCIEQKNNND